jgi:hypothetical protein
MTAALIDTHVHITSALERGLEKVATVGTAAGGGPKQHDSLTSISGSSAADEAIPPSSKRSSRSQSNVSWSDASPTISLRITEVQLDSVSVATHSGRLHAHAVSSAHCSYVSFP